MSAYIGQVIKLIVNGASDNMILFCFLGPKESSSCKLSSNKVLCEYCS